MGSESSYCFVSWEHPGSSWKCGLAVEFSLAIFKYKFDVTSPTIPYYSYQSLVEY